MIDPTKPLPEDHYALLFPQQPTPAWALEKMELFESDNYDFLQEQTETVPLAHVVGTNHPNYGNKLSWLDMLTRSKRSSNFALTNWPGFLDAKTSNITLARLAGTDKYYIFSGGNHRVSGLKLAGRPTITCSVVIAHPR
jgi:hypothetical protein